MSVKSSKQIVRYCSSFKLMVVQEIEQGHNFEHVRKKYDIGGSDTVQNWIKKYGKHHLLNKIVRIETMKDKGQLKQLQEENRRLKQKLAETYMIKDCLEEVIKMADEEYKTDLKKNFGIQSPANSRKDTP